MFTHESDGLAGDRQSTGGTLKNACYRSLGSLAKNALFTDLVDMLVWPLTALDRGESCPSRSTEWTD